MKKNILLKVLIIGVPTYTAAIITKAMVFTMPMLAITTVIATNLYDDAKRMKIEFTKVMQQMAETLGILMDDLCNN
jgi:hypothetical protein